MMTYFLDSHLDSGDIYSPLGNSAAKRQRPSRREGIHLLTEKLSVPKYRGLVARPRLDELLSRSIEQFPATLISGRAGTGKTALASTFARSQQHAAWYSVESSDIEWNVFIHYFAAGVLRAVKSKAKPKDLLPTNAEPNQSSMASSLISIFAEAETELLHEPLLIVLDGIHCLFDAPWFGEFFGLLLSSLPENTNLLLLCRSKPPSPLWRLRSKQQLHVIDEKLLAFTLPETVELVTKLGLKRSDAERAHADTFGRVSKLLEVADRGSAKRRL
ncbi:MAG TPA: AAA family ATPase [Pyrinomonadaceae bacterium]|nr:AAA family ATPase [Pyrinomonadaceae bacterium]